MCEREKKRLRCHSFRSLFTFRLEDSENTKHLQERERQPLHRGDVHSQRHGEDVMNDEVDDEAKHERSQPNRGKGVRHSIPAVHAATSTSHGAFGDVACAAKRASVAFVCVTPGARF